MTYQNPVLTDMLGRLNAFREGSFGIDRRDGPAPWVLCASRQIFPIGSLRLSLWDQEGFSICDFEELPASHSLIFDEAGEAPATCRLALIDKQRQSVVALADDSSPVNGYLAVSIRPQSPGTQPWVISALFSVDQGRQLSSLLWHDDPELVRFLNIQRELLERGSAANAQQLQPESFSDGFNPFS